MKESKTTTISDSSESEILKEAGVVHGDPPHRQLAKLIKFYRECYGNKPEVLPFFELAGGTPRQGRRND